MRRSIVILALASAATVFAQTSVLDTPHNLSAGGPGAVRALSEDEVCIFCHTPHNAAPIRPLWNRATPDGAFAIYTSRSLDAQPGQPTGASKMCLSCHDGTIALGAVLSRDTPIMMTTGSTIPSGPSHIGTDLRDDHPVSFRYDQSLPVLDPAIRDPAQLPPEIRLDGNLELQCTACHDAHDNSLGKFLVMRNDRSQLCTSCHQVGTTTVRGHAGCHACHQPHTAPSGPYLLRHETISETCMACHDGSVAGAANILAEMNKPFAHDNNPPVDPPEPAHHHATCTDCHDPHTMGSGGSVPAGASAGQSIQSNLGSVGGVNSSGTPVSAASSEYEVCFVCHADETAARPLVSRYLVQHNTRLEFNPGAISFHPVISPGVNPDVASLRPGLTTSSIISCSDCHASDASRIEGKTGVHGSIHEALLVDQYETADYTDESAHSYALCYRCHDRSSILGDESFPFHRLHIEGERTSCAACHDAHGIASAQGSAMANSHLINFATDVVFPDSSGRMGFRDTGLFSGECFMSCHGTNHSPAVYP